MEKKSSNIRFNNNNPFKSIETDFICDKKHEKEEEVSTVKKRVIKKNNITKSEDDNE